MTAVVGRVSDGEVRVAAVGSWIGAGLVLDQVLQVWSVVDRFDIAVPAWRFQVALLLSGKLIALMLAATILIATARLRGTSRPVPALLFGLAGIALGSIVAAAVLLVDGGEVAYAVPGEQFRGFTSSRLRGIGLLLAGAAVFWSLFRTVRAAHGDRATGS